MGRRLSVADISDRRDRYGGNKPEQNIWISGDVENLRPMMFISKYIKDCSTQLSVVLLGFHMGVTNGIQPSLKKFCSFFRRARQKLSAHQTGTASSVLDQVCYHWLGFPHRGILGSKKQETHIEECDLLLHPVKAKLHGHYTNVCW